MQIPIITSHRNRARGNNIFRQVRAEQPVILSMKRL